MVDVKAYNVFPGEDPRKSRWLMIDSPKNICFRHP